jgi:glutamate carboxypeptidase
MSQDAIKWLAEQQLAMENTIADLVAINSFTENTEGGNAVATQLISSFPFLEAQRVASKRFADHLVFRSAGAKQMSPIALVGHLDTVFPPGTFEGYKNDGDLARGPGVLDMKGGLVVVAYALRALAETVGLDRVAPLRLVIVSDEEVGSPESKAIIEREAAGAGAALVFESGRANDLIITRRKGTGVMNARVTGKAAHAGNNHKDGKNAIWTLAKYIDAVQQLTAYDRGVTVNVGKVSGGQSKNTVPDAAEAQIDLRFESEADAHALIAQFHELAKTCALPGTAVMLEGGIARMPLERSAASALLLERYARAAAASGLGCAEAGLIGGGSDASTTSALGVASIDGLGPRGAGFHTKDEHIVRATLILKAQALVRFLLAESGL